jgi:chemotaxis protein CheD
VGAIKQHYLYPSAIFADRVPTDIGTLLGSCVAVCLYDTHNHFGGMNHFMLSVWKGHGLASPKYGNIAMDALLEKMTTLGCSRKHLVAKVFGGGDVLGKVNSIYQIGPNNIAVAMEMLDRYGIPVVAKSTGGQRGRKVNFNNLTGEVLMRYIESREELDLKRAG